MPPLLLWWYVRALQFAKINKLNLYWHSIFCANHHVGFKGVAKEARRMCEWMRNVNQLYVFQGYSEIHKMGQCDEIRIPTFRLFENILSNITGYEIHHFLVGLSLCHNFFRQFMFFNGHKQSEVINTIIVL